jgi:hypothetical protein
MALAGHVDGRRLAQMEGKRLNDRVVGSWIAKVIGDEVSGESVKISR